jgi:UDP-glucose 4-epimerase
MKISGTFCIVGGAGFIGSHFVERLLSYPDTSRVTVFDNFSSGQRWHLDPHERDSRLAVLEGDAKELGTLTKALEGITEVIHLASNPDIAKAATQPDVDFWEGTLITQNVLEAMRLTGGRRILYASGSGVYGDLGETVASEGTLNLRPVSTYGASKLAGEALISAYASLFGIQGFCFRFGNVIGPRQTHGVGRDFLLRLKQDSKRLNVLGDGTQSKSYIHVHDVVDAVLQVRDRSREVFDVFNVATPDYLTVREIAELAIESLDLARDSVEVTFGSTNRGWAGDVPIVRLSTQKMRELGWNCSRTTRQAMKDALRSIRHELEQQPR